MLELSGARQTPGSIRKLFQEMGKGRSAFTQEKKARHLSGAAVPGRSVAILSMKELREHIFTKVGSDQLKFTKDRK